jgi:hypothetical protein
MTEIQPEKRLIGYARVSIYGQTLDAQTDQLPRASEPVATIKIFASPGRR